MKVLVFADIHGHNFREFSYIDEDGFNSRLMDQVEVITKIHESAHVNKVDRVWFLGDLTHLKNNMDTQVIRTLMVELGYIGSNFPVWIIPGNHDYRMWNSDPALLEMLTDWDDRITIARRFEWAGVEHEGERVRVRVLPYQRAIIGTNKEIEELNTNPEKDVFLGHQDVVGVNYGGFVVEKGLDADILSKKFKLSLLGHCHDSQKIRDNVYSVGAPMQHNFGDFLSPRGWWILDTKTYEMKFIENDFSPRFWKIKTNQENEPQDLPGNPEKDFYWITVKGSELPVRFKSIRWKRVSFEIKNEKKERVGISLSDSFEDIIEKYVKYQNTNLDEKKLIKFGRGYV